METKETKVIKVISKKDNPAEYAAVIFATLAWLESRKKIHPEEFVWVTNKETEVGAPHFRPDIPMPIFGIDIDLSSEAEIARLAMLHYNEAPPRNNPYFLVIRQD
jgi:hypothetical protein